MHEHEICDVVILSAARPGLSANDQAVRLADAVLEFQTQGVSCAFVFGRYEGKAETGLAVFCNGVVGFADIAAYYAFTVLQQDSILRLGPVQKNRTREAVLQYATPHAAERFERIGFWRAVSAHEALLYDTFTFVPHVGEYYVAKKD